MNALIISVLLRGPVFYKPSLGKHAITKVGNEVQPALVIGKVYGCSAGGTVHFSLADQAPLCVVYL